MVEINRRRFRTHLIEWYKTHCRQLPWRETRDPYAIWVSEVMLQQTQVQTVQSYYRRFLDRFPDLKHLAEADLQEVLIVWEGMGYYARARNLHRSAQIVVEKYNGRIPRSYAEIQALPGIGDYIASAVLSIAYHQPQPVVDGNVKRVIARLYQMDEPVNKASSYKEFKKSAAALMDRQRPGTFNQAMMELGALICTPRSPDCRDCPVTAHCLAFRSHCVEAYPRRLKRKSVPTHRVSVGIVFRKGRVLITQRKSEGLLGGLWEFPGGKTAADEAADAACVREIKEEVNLMVNAEKHLTRIKHAYTHFKIVMDVFICKAVSGRIRLNGPVAYRWIRLDELDRYPFPKANRKFIPKLIEQYGSTSPEGLQRI